MSTNSNKNITKICGGKSLLIPLVAKIKFATSGTG